MCKFRISYVSQERKALANDYAKDQSVGGHRAQDLIKVTRAA